MVHQINANARFWCNRHIIRLIVMVLHPQRRRLKVLKNAERHLWVIFAALIGIGVLTLASYAYLTGGL